MIIAIDGPAGSGKSSTARAVAAQLGFQHLDSGAFYRALTWAALAAGVPPAEWGDLGPPWLDALGLVARPAGQGFALSIGGRELHAELRTPEVTALVSTMARQPRVRSWLLEQLRALARGVDLVADGRDVGTVVFPDADLKVFLVASPAERARRRLLEQGVAAPDARQVHAEEARLLERDRVDSEREIAPLRKAPGAVELDTTRLDFDAQVAEVTRLASERMSG